MRADPVDEFVKQLDWPSGIVDIYHSARGGLTSIWAIIEHFDIELETKIAEAQSEVLRKFPHTRLSFRVVPKELLSTPSTLLPNAVKCKKPGM